MLIYRVNSTSCFVIEGTLQLLGGIGVVVVATGVVTLLFLTGFVIKDLSNICSMVRLVFLSLLRRRWSRSFTKLIDFVIAPIAVPVGLLGLNAMKSSILGCSITDGSPRKTNTSQYVENHE